jgi:hypothetical protein
MYLSPLNPKGKGTHLFSCSAKSRCVYASGLNINIQHPIRCMNNQLLLVAFKGQRINTEDAE